MTKITILSILVLLSFTAFGQVDPLYAQYMNNPFLINPAYAGYSNDVNGALSYRKQWAGFDGNPTTISASVHSSVADNKMGLGLFLSKDEIGISNNTEIQAAYSYKIDLGESMLAFGLQAGLINFRNNFNDLNPQDPSAPEFSSNLNFSKFSVGSGVLLTSEKYLIGLSVPRMLKASADFGTGETVIYKQHFYLQGAYIFHLNPRVKFKPSVLMKGVSGSPISVDYNASFTFEDLYTAGLFTRNFEAYGFIGQVRFKDKYRLGYAFEVPTNTSVGTRFTTHEVSLGINLSMLSFHDAFAIRSF